MNEDLSQLGPEYIQLIDGQIVRRDAEEWRAECEQRDRHIHNLKRCQTRQDRIEYLQRVEMREGAEAAKRLKERFELVWRREHEAND